jgi:cell division protein FtsW
VLSKFILIISACLITLGLTFIYSSSCVIAYSEYNDAAFFLKRQFVFLLIGIIVIYKTINLKMEYYKQYADYLYFSSIALLILVLIPGIGKSAGGSFRWISLGLFQVQAG